MSKRVLVASVEAELGLKLLSRIGLTDAEVIVSNKLVSAIRSVRRNEFDLIILGDLLKEGDIKDFALELTNTKNRKTAVVCVGYNKGKAHRLKSLVGQHCLYSEEAEDEGVAQLLMSYFGIEGAQNS